MKIYLDSTDTYYSINHEAKEKRKQNKNDATIGKISLVMIIVYAVYLICRHL